MENTFNQSMRALIMGEDTEQGYCIFIDTDEDAPINIYAWDTNTQRMKQIRLDHVALEALARYFIEEVGKRGIYNGKEERLYS